MRRRALYWHHFYLNHPCGSIIDKNFQYIRCRKGLVTKVEMYSKPCKICKQLKKVNTIYERLPPNDIVELKSWDTVHVHMIDTYSESIIQHQPSGTIIDNNLSPTRMQMIDHDTGWFGIIRMPTY